MTHYDLTKTMSPYFDRHLVFPLLEFLCGKEIHDMEVVQNVMLESLEKTKMIDYAMDVYQRCHGEVPQEYNDKREAMVEELRTVQSCVKPILAIFSDKVLQEYSDKKENVQSAKEFIDKLVRDHGFDMSMLDKLFSYAKVVFDCGNYVHAADALKIVQTLNTDNEKRLMQTTWGKLACMILSQSWEEAEHDLRRLKNLLDNTTQLSQLELLQNRTWLLHWSLFVFFNDPKGKEHLIDLFLQPEMLNAIQTLAPHLLRYLSVCIIINNKKHKQKLKDLVKIIQQEAYNYRDPITEIIESLYVNYDFENISEKLKICEQVLTNDFFLTACDEDFMKAVRLLILESFSRIHHTITMDRLSEKLNMDSNDAESWFVDLLPYLKNDARMDTKLDVITMGTQTISPYIQIQDKMKTMKYRADTHLAILKKKSGNQADLF